MKYKYDSETDILVVTLSEESPDFAEQKGSIITHYSSSGVPVELEILNAAEVIGDWLSVINKQKHEVKPL